MEMLQCGYQVISAGGKPLGKSSPTHHNKARNNNKRSFSSVTEGAPSFTRDSKFHNGCGHAHPGKECALSKHPDYNHSDLPWNKSKSGEAWKAKGWFQLPYNQTLDPSVIWVAPPLPEMKPRVNKYVNKTWKKDDQGEELSFYDSAFIHKCPPVHRKTVPCVEQHVFSLSSSIDSLVNSNSNTDHTNNITIPFFVSTKGTKVKVNALLDTGALHSNYISERLADIFTESGNVGCQCSTKICSPINESCLINENNSKFSFHLIHELANINTDITAVVLPSNYDLIIGRETLKKLRLIEKFASHFCQTTLNTLVIKNQKNVYIVC
jgi:hypothetical protein